MPYIVSTFEVLKLLKFIEVNDVHPSNKLLKYFALEVSKLSTYIYKC